MFVDNRAEDEYNYGESRDPGGVERARLDPSQKWAVVTVLGFATSAIQKEGWPRRATLSVSALAAGMTLLTAGSMTVDVSSVTNNHKE